MNAQPNANLIAIEPKDRIPKDPKPYDEALHARFLRWRDHSGKSDRQIGAKLNRNEKIVQQYANLEYEGPISILEKDVKSLLFREEDFNFTTRPDVFCQTSISSSIFEVIEFCDRYHEMAMIISSAGAGKTEAAKERTRKNPNTMLITVDLTRRSLGSVLTIIGEKVCHRSFGNLLNSERLGVIIKELKNADRLLIIDEAHLLSWEAFDTLRTIYDHSKIAIVFMGMPRLYSQMKDSRKGFLWDQISSRIAIQRYVDTIEFKDVALIADSIYPGLPKKCLEFLYQKANGSGKFRTMIKLLKSAVRFSDIDKIPLNLNLLKEIDSLMKI